jgi:O-antigen ligase
MGLELVGALVFLPLAFANPPFALALWMVTPFVSSLHGMGPVSNRSVLLLFAIWVGSLGSREFRERAAGRQWRLQYTAIVLFVLWILITTIWAPLPSHASDPITHYMKAAIVLLVVTGFVTEPKHVRWLAAGFVAGAVLSILIGAVDGGLHTAASAATSTTSKQGRLQGGTSDPNYLAAAIVPAIMFAAGLAAQKSRLLVRVSLGIALAVLAVGLAATESRGGALAAIVVSLLALLFWRGRRRTVAIAIAVVVVAAGAWFSASPSSLQRVTSNSDGGSGRNEIWLVAWRVVEAHPIVGVGLGNFSAVSPDYIRRPGSLTRADQIVDQHLVVHNSYLQLWVETGLIGLLLFLSIAATSMLAARDAARQFDARGDPEMATLARAAMLALVGSLTASFFLTNVDDRRLWVLLALGPAMLGIARRGGAIRKNLAA